MAKNAIPQKMLTGNSAKSGSKAGGSGVTPIGYINETSWLMQAVSSQI